MVGPHLGPTTSEELVEDKRFYWLKLKKDFFKKAEIMILENMPAGKDYEIFYLKLLCESTAHEGRLRLSETIPYDETMLGAVTNTDPNTVKMAVQVLTKLGLMEVLDDGTLFMTELSGMVGSAANNDNANRQRRFREKKKAEEIAETKVAILPEAPKKETKKEYGEGFERFWAVYPRKVNKGAAFDKYLARLRSGFSEDELLRSAEGYAMECRKYGTEQRYIKHAATFLSERLPFLDYLPKNKEQENQDVLF